MTTARARMLELSPLTNTTARLHFLAITQTGVAGDVYLGTPLTATIAGTLEASIGATISATLDPEPLVAVVGTETLSAEIVLDNESTLCQ